MNKGKLEVVKQEMARVNINILGISELKWTGMGEFNSDDHYIYYCGQESLRRNGVAIIFNKRVQNAVLGCNLKNDRMISVHLQGKPLNITVKWVKSLSCVRLFVTPWTVAYQIPLSMWFSRQEYWSGLQFPSPRDFPGFSQSNPGLPHCRQML